MSKALRRLEQEVQKIEREIENLTGRRNETEQRLSEYEGKLKSLDEELKNALLNETGSVNRIEEERFKLISGQNQDRILLDALEKKLSETRESLKAVIKNRDQEFADLCKKYLTNEAKKHDELVIALAESRKKLVAVQGLLNEVGFGEVQPSVLGRAAWLHMKSNVLVRFDDFNVNEFCQELYGPSAHYQFSPDEKTLAMVHQEITR